MKLDILKMSKMEYWGEVLKWHFFEKVDCEHNAKKMELMENV